ncbi:Retrovirus-related Pol polyprotein from transposon opus, partial [Mucuna pruriens]
MEPQASMSSIMSFGLKNARATYQRMMETVFEGKIGKSVKVYLDNMVVMFEKKGDYYEALREFITTLRKHKLKLNLEKCLFGVQERTFLGYRLTRRGIEANPDKCRVVMEMRSPKNIKEIYRLMGKVASLAHFLLKSMEKAILFFNA